MNYIQIQSYALSKLKTHRDFMTKYKKLTGIYLRLLNEKIRLINNNCYKPILTLMSLTDNQEDTNFRLIKTPQGMCFSNGEKIFPPHYKDEDFRKEGYCIATIQKPHWVRLKNNVVEIYECEQHPYIILAEALLKNEDDAGKILLDFNGSAFKEYKRNDKKSEETNETGLTETPVSVISEEHSEELNKVNNEVIETLLEDDDFDY